MEKIVDLSINKIGKRIVVIKTTNIFWRRIAYFFGFRVSISGKVFCNTKLFGCWFKSQSFSFVFKF